MSRLVAISESGTRMGEGHGRAKLSDHDVELILALLDARTDALEAGKAAGMSPSQLCAHLNALQLSYRWIGLKFEVTKKHIANIAHSRVRCAVAVRWVRCT